jgi:hypothetical protein
MSKVNRPRRIDVNLGELDQIIDRSMRAPLSEAEGQKLKTALHAMAERLWWKRSTEKTSSILPPEAVPAEKPGESAPAGPWPPWRGGVYRRKQSYGSARHAPLRRPLPGMPRGKSLPPEGTSDTGTIRGAGTAGSDRVRNGATALQRLRAGVYSR